MIISTISIIISSLSALVIAIDLTKRAQPIKIMNLVWVLTAVWSSIFGLIAYFTFARARKDREQHPLWQSVILATLQCGAGCTFADISRAIFLSIAPISLAGSTLLVRWGGNYLIALFFGFWFQYISTKSTSNIRGTKLLTKALIVNFISLTTWKITMYICLYTLIFKIQLIESYQTLNLDFWFAVQISMFAGFLFALPVNYLLIKTGLKSRI